MSAPLRNKPHESAGSSWIEPPRLRTGRAGGNASRLELFFDLAYVLAVLELATTFLHDLTWHGLGVLAGLFTALWFSWVGFTLYANRFDTDDVIFRAGKLAATLAVAGCAASASSATADYGTAFAWSFLAGRVILALLYVRAWRWIPDARPTLGTYLATAALSAGLWAASIPMAEPTRYWLWAAAVAVDAAGPLLATLRRTSLPLHIEHLPERFGLLVLLVLGEAVGGAATGVHDAQWVAPSVHVGIIGFLIAAGLWWIYFDVAATSSSESLTEEQDGDEEHTQQDEDEGDRQQDEDRDDNEEQGSGGSESGADHRRDLFVYGHLPLTLGVVMAGVGIEDLVLHPNDRQPTPGGWIMTGGIALFLLGAALIVAGTTRSLRQGRVWLLSAVSLAALSFLPYPAALPLTAVAAALILTLAVIGTRQRLTSKPTAHQR